MRIELAGNDLLHVLSVTTQQVKILQGGYVIDRVSAAEAYRRARDEEYVGSGTRTRVKAMWERFPRCWQPSYRTQGAPSIGPWAGGSPSWYDAYRT